MKTTPNILQSSK